MTNRYFRALAGGVYLCLATTAFAQPPDHAKADGWRKKNDPAYRGYTGVQWERDFGVVAAGRCNTDQVLAAIGAVAGAATGVWVTGPENRTIAILAGATIGAIIGDQIGKRIDRVDQACLGHSLELAATGKTVAWKNPRSGVAYRLTPAGEAGPACRRFRLDAVAGDRKEGTERVACRAGDGRWELRS